MSLENDSKTKASYHVLSIEEAIKSLNSSVNGITEEEALKRIDLYGRNKLEEGKKRTIFMMFIEQFKNIMIIILLIAAAISVYLGEATDAVIILLVVAINSVLGVMQESKAEKALLALKKMSSPYAKVKRDGEVKKIKSEDVVPGDIILLEAGDFVPADMRLVESFSLKIEESALTGESVPVEKNTDKIEQEDIVIGDRKNMAYMGSSVTYGRGIGFVSGTGMNTEVGKIAGYITNAEVEVTPLQKKLEEMSKYLSVGVVVIAVIIFIAGILRQRPAFDMFLISVSLAVAAIPEGLPAIVTIVLAMGVQKMAGNNAIIRKLPAVETLGSTEIICSDKTGTLTQNKMTVKEVFINGNLFPEDKLSEECRDLELFMQIMSLCNDSKITRVDNDSVNVIGDPTETALIYFAGNKGFDKDEMERTIPRRNEIPFDSDRKLMTTIHAVDRGYRVMTKGAVDVLLKNCTHISVNGVVQPVTEKLANDINKANKAMGDKALRVLALAYRDFDNMPEDITPDKIERDLVFVGLVGMIDPPREEVKEAVKTCIAAGIRPVMITGDHRDTAAAIAKELNIIKDESGIITGSELDKISDEVFDKDVTKYSVYARVSPEHKVRIVKAWKKNGKVVAMTGDGVNDAPALKTADIGVGMGITGTDVSKSVSDMVLSDDNFATIVLAVREGRKIYSNIRKSIQFLLSANMSEVITLFIATMLNWEILSPIHILWINLVTDAFPALALGVEREEKDIMKQKPRKSEKSFFADGIGVSVIYQGLVLGLVTLGVFQLGTAMFPSEDNIIARTMAFAVLGIIQLTHSMNVRSNEKSLFSIGLFTNMYLIGAVILSLLLQLIVIVVPFLNTIFKVTQIGLQQWLIVLAASIIVIPIVEAVKLVSRLADKKDGK
ncbi:MAG: calcium-translocating P-type ATPase, SERCA-type [Clostridiaceae bacterium]|nr:calcium-translocating P-type ATPase, SERCA-type [Clostridiaceae bacterium]